MYFVFYTHICKRNIRSIQPASKPDTSLMNKYVIYLNYKYIIRANLSILSENTSIYKASQYIMRLGISIRGSLFMLDYHHTLNDIWSKIAVLKWTLFTPQRYFPYLWYFLHLRAIILMRGRKGNGECGKMTNWW